MTMRTSHIMCVENAKFNRMKGNQVQINLTKAQILDYTKKYDEHVRLYNPKDLSGEQEINERMNHASKMGYITQEDLIAVVNWKSPRARPLCQKNCQTEIKEISCASFTAKSERLRIGSLLILKGVSWPMASVILHFRFPKKYPILDVRAMNTVGGSTNYNFELWIEYVELCGNAAVRHGITLRELDKALWMYDFENENS